MWSDVQADQQLSLVKYSCFLIITHFTAEHHYQVDALKVSFLLAWHASSFLVLCSCTNSLYPDFRSQSEWTSQKIKSCQQFRLMWCCCEAPWAIMWGDRYFTNRGARNKEFELSNTMTIMTLTSHTDKELAAYKSCPMDKRSAVLTKNWWGEAYDSAILSYAILGIMKMWPRKNFIEFPCDFQPKYAINTVSNGCIYQYCQAVLNYQMLSYKLSLPKVSDVNDNTWVLKIYF